MCSHGGIISTKVQVAWTETSGPDCPTRRKLLQLHSLWKLPPLLKYWPYFKHSLTHRLSPGLTRGPSCVPTPPSRAAGQSSIRRFCLTAIGVRGRDAVVKLSECGSLRQHLTALCVNVDETAFELEITVEGVG